MGFDWRKHMRQVIWITRGLLTEAEVQGKGDEEEVRYMSRRFPAKARRFKR